LIRKNEESIITPINNMSTGFYANRGIIRKQAPTPFSPKKVNNLLFYIVNIKKQFLSLNLFHIEAVLLPASPKTARV